MLSGSTVFLFLSAMFYEEIIFCFLFVNLLSQTMSLALFLGQNVHRLRTYDENMGSAFT